MVYGKIIVGLVLIVFLILLGVFVYNNFYSSSPIFTGKKKSVKSTEEEKEAPRCPLNYYLYDGTFGKSCSDVTDCDPDGKKWTCNYNWLCEKDGVQTNVSCRSPIDCLRTGRFMECTGGECVSRQRLRTCTSNQDCPRSSGEFPSMYDCVDGYCYGPEPIPQPFEEGTFSCGLGEVVSKPGMKARPCPIGTAEGVRCKMIDTTSPFKIPPEYPGVCTDVGDVDNTLYCLPEYLCVPDAETNSYNKQGACRPFKDVIGDAPMKKFLL